MTEKPRNIYEDAFVRLTSITESAAFRKILNKILRERLYQQSPLKADEFHQLLAKYDINLIWSIEFLHFIQKGWLWPLFIEKNGRHCLWKDRKRKLSEQQLDSSYFHPYSILEAVNCENKSSEIRAMLMIWWRRSKGRREALKRASQRENWMIGIHTPEWLRSLVSFAIALEPVYRPIITGNKTLHNHWDWNLFDKRREEVRQNMLQLTKDFSEENWKRLHECACSISHSLESNKELKTLVTLMRKEDRQDIFGKLGAAVVLREVAHCVRCLALEHGFALQEEQFREPGSYTNSYFAHFRGSPEILGGDLSAKLKFVRGFGLDFNLRVRIYVEGATEYACMKEVLAGLRFVEIIDLKGAFVEKGRLAFRENLRNDKRSHIYSLIVLDGDVGDNARIVKAAAAKEEFLGQFYLSKPDFETQNFSLEELCKICSKVSGVQIDPASIVGVTSGDDFFKKLHRAYPTTSSIKKGEEWGIALAKYAGEHSREGPERFGLFEDRPINQIFRFCVFAEKMNFANDLNDKSIDVSTGRMRGKPKG